MLHSDITEKIITAFYKVNKALGYGFYKPVYQATLFPMGYNTDIKGRKYDPKKAKQLLAEAGYPNGFETKIIAMKRENRDAIGAVQNYLNDVGIKAKIDIADRGRFSKLNKEGWQNALLWGMFIGGPILPSSIQRTLDTKGIRNHSALKPPGFQEIRGHLFDGSFLLVHLIIEPLHGLVVNGPRKKGQRLPHRREIREDFLPDHGDGSIRRKKPPVVFQRLQLVGRDPPVR